MKFGRFNKWQSLKNLCNESYRSLNLLMVMSSNFLQCHIFFIRSSVLSRYFCVRLVGYTKTIVPLALMASESIAHSAFGFMDYWLRAHSGSIVKYTNTNGEKKSRFRFHLYFGWVHLASSVRRTVTRVSQHKLDYIQLQQNLGIGLTRFVLDRSQ